MEPSKLLTFGQSLPAGPSVNLIGRSAWNIPASGAISVIGPRSLALDQVASNAAGKPVPARLIILPPFTAGPPAVANNIDAPCLDIWTATGPWLPSNAPTEI